MPSPERLLQGVTTRQFWRDLVLFQEPGCLEGVGGYRAAASGCLLVSGRKKHLEARFLGKEKESLVEVYVGKREEVRGRRSKTQ